MLHCYGTGCPFKDDCYHATQPTPGRDAFGALPYSAATNSCEHFVSNIPAEDLIRQTAYYRWLRSGCPDDCADADWQAAYHSLCRSTGRSTKDSQATS